MQFAAISTASQIERAGEANGFYRELQEELGVPVIDSMIAFKTAEFAAELKNRPGWSHSEIGGYESPPSGELKPWRLGEQYGFGDMTSWLQRAKTAPQRKED
jgi:hypothetical protein